MAGLIPQPFIDDLLDRSDIVDIVGSRIQLKKTGRNYSALCPFHNEKTPSFSVNPDKQFYYCFGCGAGGNSIQFVMDHDRVEFPEAIEQLARQHGLEVPREQESGTEKAARVQQRSYTQRLLQLMEDISAFYQAQLQTPAGQHARTYLQQRQIKTSTCEHFELGFAPSGWDTLLKHFGSSDEQRQLLFDCGMLVRNDQGSFYDRFRNRLMFPIRNRRGQVVAFGARALGDDKPKYLNSPETKLFNKSRELYGLYHSRQQRATPDYILLCEGYMDVIALQQHGVQHAVATLGTATNEHHLATLFRYCPRLVFSFDGDRAGRQAADRALQVLLPQLKDGCSARFLFLPEGEDPDSLINRQGKAAFLQAVQQAQAFSDYFFQRFADRSNMHDDLSFRAHLSQQTLPLIQRIPGQAYRQLLLQELQKRTGLNAQTLDTLLQQTPAESSAAARHASQAPAASQPEQRSTRHWPPQRKPLRYTQQHLQLTPAKRALSLLLNHPQLAHAIQWQPLNEHNPDNRLLTEIYHYIHTHPDYSDHRLLGHWLNHAENQLLLHLLARGTELELSVEASQREFIDCIQHLQEREQRQASQALLQNMSTQRQASLEQLAPELRAQILKIQQAYKAPE